MGVIKRVSMNVAIQISELTREIYPEEVHSLSKDTIHYIHNKFRRCQELHSQTILS